MHRRIVSWIKEQVKKAGAKGIVLGLSGGVDSALVAALAKKALGKSKVLALFLPCHSALQDSQDASLVARRLGIKTKKVDLSSVYDVLIKILPAANGTAIANLKPRLRMIILYYFANKLKYLVCGTGNKSEIMTGYFTKYGDAGVDILPIGGLLKREVRNLAEELGVPEQVIAKSPTAGLWAGQTDEGEMGIAYAELDEILEGMPKRRRRVSCNRNLRKVQKMVQGSGHKRQMPPVCEVK